MEHEDPTKKDLSARVIDIVAPIGKGQPRAHRLTAAHGQDRAVAEHCARHHRQSPRMLSDRVADRRSVRKK